MKKSHRKWPETTLEVTTLKQLEEIPKKPKSALSGLIASCADALQGTYLVQTLYGAQWLVAQGADGILDIIDRPTDNLDDVPSDGLIIAAVKTYKKRNEPMR